MHASNMDVDGVLQHLARMQIASCLTLFATCAGTAKASQAGQEPEQKP